MIIPFSYAISPDGLGQIIQIQTRFRYLIGKGTFSIVIRDLDHNQNIPYIFDITQPNNLWMIYTHSRHYLILSSRLQINRYQSCCNQYKNYRVNNFCRIESNGRIVRNKSMRIMIHGDLSPNDCKYVCEVSRTPGEYFTVVTLPDCPCTQSVTTFQPVLPPPGAQVSATPPPVETTEPAAVVTTTTATTSAPVSAPVSELPPPPPPGTTTTTTTTTTS